MPLLKQKNDVSLDKSLWNQWALLPLRLIIGFGFMAHGWAKWSRGPEKFGELLHQIGLAVPGIHGLGGNILGVFWRHGHSSWDFGRARNHTACDIHARGNVHGSIEVWLQFYQYDWPDENRPGIRTARLRNQPLIHRGTAAPGLEQPYPVIS